jgi:hypothetical protein
MGIIRSNTVIFGEKLSSAKCFLCGAGFKDVAILWDGLPEALWLHPGCVTDLAVCMFRDVHEVNNPGYYSNRDRRAVRGNSLTDELLGND